jgi:hypothetical protein
MKHVKSFFLFTMSMFILNTIKPIKFLLFNKKEKAIVYKLTESGNFIKSEAEDQILAWLRNKDALKLFLTEKNLYLIITKNIKNFILVDDSIFFEGFAQEYFGTSHPKNKIIRTSKNLKHLKRIVLKLFEITNSQQTEISFFEALKRN